MSFLQIPIQTYPNTALGYQALTNAVIAPPFSGQNNTAFGDGALQQNTTGYQNVAIGKATLRDNTTGNNNTSVGMNAAVFNITGNANTAVGAQAFWIGTGDSNTAIGAAALASLTTGIQNTGVGNNAGSAITTGSSNVVLGSYTGNQGGLDIRTLSNHIVLSDGAGNPRLWINNTGAVNIPGGLGLTGSLSITGGTITANNPVLSATQTWNNAAVTFTGWQLNVTDTASAAGSLLMDLRTGGVSRFSVRKGGDIGVFAATGTPSAGGFSIRLQDVGGDANDTGFGVDSSGNLWQNVAASGPGFISYIGGSEQMRLTSTGLGIGTSSPSRKLDVQGAPASIGGSGTGVLANFVNNTTAFNASPTAAISLWNRYNSGSNTFPSAVVQAGKENATDGNFAGYLSLQTTDAVGTSTERARIDSSGNLGLGVTPSAWSGLASALQVQRASIITSSASAVDTYFSSNAFYDGSWKYILSAPATQYLQNVSGDHSWRVAASGTAGNAISFTQAMTLTASGNLGIGTTNPGAKLEVYGGASGTVTNIQVGNASTAFVVGVDGSNNCQIRTAQSVPILFYTTATQRANIPAAGGMVVGIAALATNATDGFLYVPTCAGTPTGTPTTQTGTAPIVVDTTNNKLYFYSSGQWRDAGP